jgi:glycerol-3-phosphate acyltransferase PlsX
VTDAEERRVRIAVDGMGGDNAPVAVVQGVLQALEDIPDLEIVLVGAPERMAAPQRTRLSVVAAADVIGMNEHPAQAVRAKPEASIPIAVRLVKEGKADAVVSAGNTGAMMASSLLILGRIRGVPRPAIATVLPTLGRPVVALDVGATADCKPEHLLAFARMGTAYARTVFGVGEPDVGLLNIGEEPEKGSALARETHELLAASELRFVGNVEGSHVLDGKLDVLVTDGFTGNVALKLMEGTAENLVGQLKDAFMSSPRGRVAGLLAKPLLHGILRRMDYQEYGGAPLLGVSGVSVIAHGRSKARAITTAVSLTHKAVAGDLIGRITEAMAQPSGTPAPGAVE